MPSTMVLISCSEDNPVLKTDNKPWTVSTADMDPTVKPGEDFFMYCNGGYIGNQLPCKKTQR